MVIKQCSFIFVLPRRQRLDVEGENTTVILNTRFSQKVYSDAEHTDPPAPPGPLPPPARCGPYALSNTFGLHRADAVQRRDASAEQVNEGIRSRPCSLEPNGSIVLCLTSPALQFLVAVSSETETHSKIPRGRSIL